MLPFALFKIGKKVAEHSGLIDAPDPNLPKKSAWIVLQILRALTILMLLGAALAEWLMIIKAGVPEPLFVFHAITHACISFLALGLVVSELGLLRAYFLENWPLLSETHGLVWLGLCLMLLGFKLLGNLSEQINSQENLTMPIWRTVLATGILNIIFGFFNVVCSYVYKTPMYTAREVRARGSKLDGKNSAREYDDYGSTVTRSNSVRSVGNEKEQRPSAWKRVTRSFGGSKKPVISAPMPAHETESQYDNDVEQGGYNSRGSPIVPGVVRPPTALHPVNRYSEISSMPRF